MSKFKQLTDEERAAKREQEQELVKASVEALRSSEGWQQWLQSRSRFHRYSFGNQILIAWQHPTATRVAGFKKWLELGYCVSKGEKAIRIWAPVPPSKKALAAYEAARQSASTKAGVELDGERPRTHFRLTAVFAQDQIEALPPPAEPVPLAPPIVAVEGDDLADVLPALVELAASIGSSVSFEEVPGAAGGFYRLDDKSITVESRQSLNAQARTLVHELAHALVRADKQKDDPKLDYASEELVVESVALSVCGSLGLDISGASLPYLASWSQDESKREIVTATAKLVNRLACRIEDVALPILELRNVVAIREATEAVAA